MTTRQTYLSGVQRLGNSLVLCSSKASQSGVVRSSRRCWARPSMALLATSRRLGSTHCGRRRRPSEQAACIGDRGQKSMRQRRKWSSHHTCMRGGLGRECNAITPSHKNGFSLPASAVYACPLHSFESLCE